MGKITVLSPVHISSGNVYLSICIHENKRYSFSDVLKTSRDSMIFLDDNINNVLLRKDITVSKKQLFDKLNLDFQKLESKTPLYSVINKTEKNNLVNNINENIKNLSTPYIPGSTLKGYVSNVLWYDIFLENQEINKYYSNQFKETYKKINSGNSEDEYKHLKDLNKKISDITNELKGIMQLVGFHDVIFQDSSISIYESNRYLNGKKASKTIPIGSVEVIDEGETSESKFLFTGLEISRDYMNRIKKGMEEEIDKSKNKDRLSDNVFHYQKRIKHLILNEIYKRILDFKNWFPKANKRFMLEVIKKELEFLDNSDNNEIDSNSLREYLDSVKMNIEKDEIILQIGKFTNFFAKSYGNAFGELYREYFTEFFSPDPKKKTVPKIDTMNLIVKNGMGTTPFGFIRIDEL